MAVKGNIPRFVGGVLYRTGPLGYKVKTNNGKTWAANHWFDGLSCVHRFQIDFPDETGPPEVTYRSRRVVDEYLEMIKKTGKVDGVTFAAKRDFCKSFFAKVFTMFSPAPALNNVGVTLSLNLPGGKDRSSEKPLVNGHSNDINTLHVKTDSTLMKKLDPTTLEPEGIATQTTLHPDLKGPFSASHAKTDPITGDFYNFNMEPGVNAIYRVFTTSASTGETTILAKFTSKPAYIHSIFLTESFVVVCVWNSYITWGGLSILYHQNVLDAIGKFDRSQKTVWYVVDRKHGRGLVGTYESDPFFCFHSVNAWEEPSVSDPSKLDIFAELCLYDNADVINRFYYDHILSSSKANAKYAGAKRISSQPSHTQFRLPHIGSVKSTQRLPTGTIYKADKMISMDLPTINPAYLTRRHRFTYGASDRGKSSFMDGLVKFDNKTQTAIFWEQDAHTPGEPIFVADPEGKEEDDGVLLTVVLDGHAGTSYLLVLDAKDLRERGRAEMDGPMAFGFHGAFKAVGRKYGGDI